MKSTLECADEEDDNDDYDHDSELRTAIANLQLPHMPTFRSSRGSATATMAASPDTDTGVSGKNNVLRHEGKDSSSHTNNSSSLSYGADVDMEASSVPRAMQHTSQASTRFGTNERNGSNGHPSKDAISIHMDSDPAKVDAQRRPPQQQQNQQQQKQRRPMTVPKQSPLQQQSSAPIHDQLPTMRILVVADIDLASASALAEYALQQRNMLFDAGSVDLCIACGAFCRQDDLIPYLRGKQRRNHARLNGADVGGNQSRGGVGGVGAGAMNNRSSSSNSHIPAPWMATTPFFRTREETSAMEGLMTAALSQLESIVCRVVYCPGLSDPITTILSTSPFGTGESTTSTTTPSPPKRLTPNSRNIHQHWLPLAPGLGCAGLFHLDGPERLLRHYAATVASMSSSKHPHSTNTASDHLHPPHVSSYHQSYHNHHPVTGVGGCGGSVTGTGRFGYEDVNDVAANDDDDDDDDDSDQRDTAKDALQQLAGQLLSLQNTSQDYCSTLIRLLALAPKPNHPLLMQSDHAQSILVTHYVNSQALTHNQSGAASDQDEADKHDNNSHADDPYNVAERNSTEQPNIGTSASSTLEESLYLPWPWDHELSFLQSSTTQHLLCLEIASGSAASHQPRWIRSPPPPISSLRQHPTAEANEAFGTINDESFVPTSSSSSRRPPILLPGSLRQRGEFCILHVSLVEAAFVVSTEDASSFLPTSTTAKSSSGLSSLPGGSSTSSLNFSSVPSNHHRSVTSLQNTPSSSLSDRQQQQQQHQQHPHPATTATGTKIPVPRKSVPTPPAVASSNATTSSSSSSAVPVHRSKRIPPRYVWQVQAVDFHNVNRLP